jgi:hypothetical protein
MDIISMIEYLAKREDNMIPTLACRENIIRTVKANEQNPVRG